MEGLEDKLLIDRKGVPYYVPTGEINVLSFNFQNAGESKLEPFYLDPLVSLIKSKGDLVMMQEANTDFLNGLMNVLPGYELLKLSAREERGSRNSYISGEQMAILFKRGYMINYSGQGTHLKHFDGQIYSEGVPSGFDPRRALFARMQIGKEMAYAVCAHNSYEHRKEAFVRFSDAILSYPREYQRKMILGVDLNMAEVGEWDNFKVFPKDNDEVSTTVRGTESLDRIFVGKDFRARSGSVFSDYTITSDFDEIMIDAFVDKWRRHGRDYARKMQGEIIKILAEKRSDHYPIGVSVRGIDYPKALDWFESCGIDIRVKDFYQTIRPIQLEGKVFKRR